MAASAAVAYPALPAGQDRPRHPPQDRGPATGRGGTCLPLGQVIQIRSKQQRQRGWKAGAPYEFGVKASIVTNNRRAAGGLFVLHAKALPNKPYDGHLAGRHRPHRNTHRLSDRAGMSTGDIAATRRKILVVSSSPARARRLRARHRIPQGGEQPRALMPQRRRRGCCRRHPLSCRPSGFAELPVLLGCKAERSPLRIAFDRWVSDERREKTAKLRGPYCSSNRRS